LERFQDEDHSFDEKSLNVYLAPALTARIEGSPETIFDLIADMPTYACWLPGSRSVRRNDGGIAISGPPRHNLSRRGTSGPSGPAPSRGYDRPKHIAFHHTMLLKKGPFTANIDVQELKRYVKRTKQR
jgi:hypothetical protein